MLIKIGLVELGSIMLTITTTCYIFMRKLVDNENVP